MLTLELLEHALNGAGAAATAHGNVELVCVGHCVGRASGRKRVGVSGCKDAAMFVGVV